jgi:SAD/SRA domain
VEMCGAYRHVDEERESPVIDKRDDRQDGMDSPLSSPPDSPLIVRPTALTPTPSPSKTLYKTPSPRKTLAHKEREQVIGAGYDRRDEMDSPLSSPPDSPFIVPPPKPTPTPKRPNKLWREATSLWQETAQLWGEDINYGHSDEDSESEDITPRNPRREGTDSLLTSPRTSPLLTEPSRTVSQTPRPRKTPGPLDPGVIRTETSGVGRLSYDRTQPRPNGLGDTFGDLPGLYIGKRWHSRMGAGWDGTHANPMSGISTFKSQGATAIALSGGYEDDIDEGYRFLYTGSGGKGKGTGSRQAKNQEWNRTNSGLRENVLNEKPVRVIRGAKGDPLWSPARGFMYCGLYEVVACWVEAGNTPPYPPE